MSTEVLDPRFADIDAWPIELAIKAMWDEQVSATAAVKLALPQIGAAVDGAAMRLGETGRLIYAGAGTSGRIAVQDGAELGPTFSWPKERVVFAMAGGEQALIASVEDAEDNAADGAAQMTLANVNEQDAMIGVSASGATPFTLGAIDRARSLGAMTIGIACNAHSPLLSAAEYPILIDTGSEVLAGSTRMKAGTAQKITLNLISTALMVRLGRVYKGQMVDMRPNNAKLRKRAEIMVARLAACDEAVAASALSASGGQIKLAVLMAKGQNRERSQQLLTDSRGNLRDALSSGGYGQ